MKALTTKGTHRVYRTGSNPKQLFSHALQKGPVIRGYRGLYKITYCTCVRAQQMCGLSGWCSSSCWPPEAWTAAEAESGRAPASQPCVAAQGWSGSCRHRGLYDHETLPCLSPGTAITGATQWQETHNIAFWRLENDNLSGASLTACEVGRLGSKVMMVGFSPSSLSRSSVSISSSSSSSFSAKAQWEYKNMILMVTLISWFCASQTHHSSL